MTDRELMQQALEALRFALHVGFDESSESQIKKGDKAVRQHENVIAALRERLAQPEQEPVATLDDLEQEIYENTRQFVSRDVMEWMLKRYYTTPPQRKPLTDEEIEFIYADTGYNDIQMFARAIEAKLKEKNHG